MASPYASGRTGRPGRLVALAVVGGLHALAVYALATGLGRKAVEVVKRPVLAAVIEEFKPPPPPPPPPPIPKVIERAPPKIPVAPPPPYVPPPEVTPPAAAGPAITVVTNTPPTEPVAIAPPVPPAPPAPPAPAPEPPRSKDVSMVCPTQVKPEMPRQALAQGITGTVKARIVISGGVVKDVTVISGPHVFYSSVRAAVLQYKCMQAAGDVVVQQEFDFKLE